MTAHNHQTVRLSAGRHSSPDDGACVMELASMLAGERFSDYPRSVCPTIGAFLRPYNDGVSDELRADLYAVAAQVVDSAGGWKLRRRRRRACRERLLELSAENGSGRRRWSLPLWEEALGAACADAYLRAGKHREALDFIAELVAMGSTVDRVGPAQPQTSPISSVDAARSRT